MVVAFFGHSDTPCSVREPLKQAITQIIEENGSVTFYVGTHGAFDCMVRAELKAIAKEYPNIECYVVLAYYDPADKDSVEQYELPTLYPEGIENVPKRFAITFRNNFMVNVCDIVICYITRDWGGAYKFVSAAEQKNKVIINLAEKQKTFAKYNNLRKPKYKYEYFIIISHICPVFNISWIFIAKIVIF